ncbi:MAG: hypothetical protein HQL52_19330 [Magnetococcales bacterium]|nr:hypothetical protein [Magnetococcales bacterium]
MVDDDFDSLKNEMIFEAVKKAVKRDPTNWAQGMEGLGFMWVDDDNGQEELEERSAKPENARQKVLVGYFEGDIERSESILKAFMDEKNSEKPNYALIRRYFKHGNNRLKELLLFGLESSPTDVGLLNDIGFFHSHHNMLGTVISVFSRACKEEADLDKFGEIALLFHSETDPDGYDALHELGTWFDSRSPKKKVIDEIKRSLESASEQIEF